MSNSIRFPKVSQSIINDFLHRGMDAHAADNRHHGPVCGHGVYIMTQNGSV